MAPVTSPANGLSYLTEPGGILSNLPSPISSDALQSATPQDLVSLSSAALESQVVDGLFGYPSGAQTSGLPSANAMADAELVNATPQEKAAANTQAALLQQVQALFAEPGGPTGILNLAG